MDELVDLYRSASGARLSEPLRGLRAAAARGDGLRLPGRGGRTRRRCPRSAATRRSTSTRSQPRTWRPRSSARSMGISSGEGSPGRPRSRGRRAPARTTASTGRSPPDQGEADDVTARTRDLATEQAVQGPEREEPRERPRVRGVPVRLHAHDLARRRARARARTRRARRRARRRTSAGRSSGRRRARAPHTSARRASPRGTSQHRQGHEHPPAGPDDACELGERTRPRRRRSMCSSTEIEYAWSKLVSSKGSALPSAARNSTPEPAASARQVAISDSSSSTHVTRTPPPSELDGEELRAREVEHALSGPRAELLERPRSSR